MEFGETDRTGQVTISTTATLIAAARPERTSVTLVNGGATDVFIGGPAVTITTGVLLVGTKGTQLPLYGGESVYGVVGTGTAVVSFVEVF